MICGIVKEFLAAKLCAADTVRVKAKTKLGDANRMCDSCTRNALLFASHFPQQEKHKQQRTHGQQQLSGLRNHGFVSTLKTQRANQSANIREVQLRKRNRIIGLFDRWQEG